MYNTRLEVCECATDMTEDPNTGLCKCNIKDKIWNPDKGECECPPEKHWEATFNACLPGCKIAGNNSIGNWNKTTKTCEIPGATTGATPPSS